MSIALFGRSFVPEGRQGSIDRCSKTEPENAIDEAKPGAEVAQSPSQLHDESSKARIMKENERQKTKSKRRRKRTPGSSNNDVDGASSSLSDQTLLATFERVMEQGLCLSTEDRPEMHFWITNNSMLRWGIKRGKERGANALNQIKSVEDLGQLEFRLAFTTGSILQIGASCAVEKNLLMRSFTLLMRRGEEQGPSLSA